MPGYHNCAGGKNCPGLMTMEVLSTCSRGWVEFYRRAGTINTFDFPLNDMTQFGDTVAMDYDGMEAYLSAGGNTNWWLARFYGNYNNHLDGYVRWGTCPGMIYHYELSVPDYLYMGVPVNEHGIYADPRHWFRATSLRFIRAYTDAEFAAINTLAVDTSIPDAANDSNEPISVDDLPILESVQFLPFAIAPRTEVVNVAIADPVEPMTVDSNTGGGDAMAEPMADSSADEAAIAEAVIAAGA